MRKVNNMANFLDVYKPSTGGTVYGFGIVRKTFNGESSKYSKVFESKSGKIYFNTYNDAQIKGIKELKTLVDINE